MKLQNGDEIVAEMVSADTFKNPLIIERVTFQDYDDMGNPDTKGFYTMKAWFLLQFVDRSDVIVMIPRDRIVTSLESNSDVVEQYEMTVKYFKKESANEKAQMIMEDQLENSDSSGNLVVFPGPKTIQ